jgi:hypothetical protein
LYGQSLLHCCIFEPIGGLIWVYGSKVEEKNKPGVPKDPQHPIFGPIILTQTHPQMLPNSVFVDCF